ncbi:MAG: PQQ-binding-like beta-propeller repeat protein, partial [bacterium]
MGRWRTIGAAVTVVGLLALTAGVPVPLPAATIGSSVWRTSPGPINIAFVSGTANAVVGSVSFDQTTGRPSGHVALVDALSARELWSVEYRNSQCCLIPAVGVLPPGRRIFASGDELLLLSLGGNPTSRLELGGSTRDMAAAGGDVLVGTLRDEVVAFQANRILWRTRHPGLMAVALSADGLAAAGSRHVVVIFDARTGRPVRHVPLSETTAVDLTLAQGALLVVAQKTTGGDVRLLGIDAHTGRHRWSVAYGPTSLPLVTTAGRVI